MANLSRKMAFKPSTFVSDGKQNSLVRKGEEIQALAQKYGVEDAHAYGLNQLLNTLRIKNNSGMTLQLKQNFCRSQGLVVALLNIGQTDLALDVWKWYISVVVFAMETGDRETAVDMWKILVEQVPRLTMHAKKDISFLEWQEIADELRNADDPYLNTAWWRELVDELLSMLKTGKNEIANECWNMLKVYLFWLLENNCLSLASKLWDVLVYQLTHLQETGQNTVALEWWKALVYCLTDVLEHSLFETASEWCVSLTGKLQALMASKETNDVNDWWTTVFYCLLEFLNSKKVQVAGDLWKLFALQLPLLTQSGQTELATRWWYFVVHCLMQTLDNTPPELASECWKILIELMVGALEKGQTQMTVTRWWNYLSDQVTSHLNDQKKAHPVVWWRALIQQVMLALKEQVSEAPKWWAMLVRQVVDVLKTGQHDKATECWSYLIETVTDERKKGREEVAVSCWLAMILELRGITGAIHENTIESWWIMLVEHLPEFGGVSALQMWKITADGIAILPRCGIVIKLWKEMNSVVRSTVSNGLDAALPLLLCLVESTPVVLKGISEEKKPELYKTLLNSVEVFLMRSKRSSDFKAARELAEILAVMLKLADQKSRPQIVQMLVNLALTPQFINNKSGDDRKVLLMFWKTLVDGVLEAMGNSIPDDVMKVWKMLLNVVSTHRKTGSQDMAVSMWETLLNQLQNVIQAYPENSEEIYEGLLDMVPDFLEQDHKEKIFHHWDGLVQLAADHPGTGNNVRGFWRIVSCKVLDVLRADNKPVAFKMWGAMLNLVPAVLDRCMHASGSTPLLAIWRELRGIARKVVHMGDENEHIGYRLQTEMEDMYYTLTKKRIPGELSDALMEVLNDQIKTEQIGMTEHKTSKNIKSYPMKSVRRGLALIINNYSFQDDDDANRQGSWEDEKALCSTLQILDFDVAIKRDQTKDDMITSITEFAKCEEHKDKDAAVLAVMTHGDEKGLYGTDMELISTEKVILSFCNKEAQHLVGKPKWLLFQACRGPRHNFTMPVKDQARKSLLPKIKRTSNSPMGDTCITHATIPGYIAWRDECHGSWMIQFLCKEIKEHWRQWCLEDILTKVQESVGDIKWTGPLGVEQTQIMEVSYRGWKKKLYFFDDEAGGERQAAEARKRAAEQQPKEKKGMLSKWLGFG